MIRDVLSLSLGFQQDLKCEPEIQMCQLHVPIPGCHDVPEAVLVYLDHGVLEGSEKYVGLDSAD